MRLKMAEQHKNPVGQPKWIPTKEHIDKVESYGALGMTKKDIARCIGICYDTLREREKEYAEFSAAIKRGEAKGLAQVAADLIKNVKKGNATAQIFYLKCRGKGKWVDDENLRLLEKRIARMEKNQLHNDHKDGEHGREKMDTESDT